MSGSRERVTFKSSDKPSPPLDRGLYTPYLEWAGRSENALITLELQATIGEGV